MHTRRTQRGRTQEERRFERERSELATLDATLSHKRTLPSQVRTARKRYRKALYHYKMAATHPALSKPWEHYSYSRLSHGHIKRRYAKPEADTAYRLSVECETMKDSLTRLEGELTDRSRDIADVKRAIVISRLNLDGYRLAAERSRKTLDAKKEKQVSARTTKTKMPEYLCIGEGYISRSAHDAYTRLCKKLHVALTATIADGWYILTHATGECRLVLQPSIPANATWASCR